MKELYFSNLLHKESEKKGSTLAKENAFKALKTLLNPMGLKEEYNLVLFYSPF